MWSSATNEDMREFFFVRCFPMSISDYGVDEYSKVSKAFGAELEASRMPWLRSTESFKSNIDVDPIDVQPSHLWNHEERWDYLIINLY